MAKLISKIYGDALFSLAIEEDKVEALGKETALVLTTLQENPDFLTILCHPEMSQKAKKESVERVFKTNCSQEMMGLLDVLIRKGRIGEVQSVLEYFMDRVNEYQKIGNVTVTTPIAVTEEQKKQIEKKLLEVSNYETLSIDYQIDKNLLGGIVIRMGNRILDNSIRAKIDAMTRKLSKVKLSNGQKEGV